jgi:hypothetical protein
MKTAFLLENNSSYPKQRGYVNIIGKRPDNPPYVSISFYHEGDQISHGWIADKDIERFAVNILKAIKSKKLAP